MEFLQEPANSSIGLFNCLHYVTTTMLIYACGGGSNLFYGHLLDVFCRKNTIEKFRRNILLDLLLTRLTRRCKFEYFKDKN